MKIGLICGHGTTDPGAVSKIYGSEAQRVRELVPLISKYLKEYDTQVVIFDPKIHWYRHLQKKAFNFKSFDYVMEVHMNAGARDNIGNGRTTGVEIYVNPDERGTSVEEEIMRKLSTVGYRNRGVKRANFFVIRKIKSQGVSSSLIEVGFIDDVDDMKLFVSKKNEIAKVIAEGIAEGFGLKKRSVIAVGDSVRVKNAIQYDNGKPFKVYHDKYKVLKLYKQRAVIGFNGVITAAVHVNNLEKV